MRLSIETLMKFSARKMWVSIVTPGRPGWSSLTRLVDVARHLERVAPRVFLDDHQQPGAAVDDRVAGQRLRADREVGHVAEAHGIARRCP